MCGISPVFQRLGLPKGAQKRSGRCRRCDVIDLGNIAARGFVGLSYTITSYAAGNAIASATTTVIPAYDEFVPSHWEVRCGGIDEARAAIGAALALVDGECGEPVFVPDQIISHPAQSISAGEAVGSMASSGDPFTFNLGPGASLSLPPGLTQSFAFTLAPTTGVPEPAPIALLTLAGLAALVLTNRRAGRRRKEQCAQALLAVDITSNKA